MSAASEIDRKVSRLAAAAAAAGAGGVLILAHWNFAWLTGGASNRIDVSREAGAGALLVGSDGRRMILANEIEMPRLASEALDGLDFEPVSFPWVDERADPAFLARRAAEVLGAGLLAADLPIGGGLPFEPTLSKLRTQLEPEDVERYRRLGADVGRTVGDAVRSLPVGATEDEAIRSVGASVLRAGARPLVLLAAADERLLRFRHPIPTTTPWRDRLMVAVCAERHGLVVALSRLVALRPPDAEILRRLSAAQHVFAALLHASVPGASAASLFEVAARAYAAEGYPGEEARHHQGGGIGYKSREWIAHPRATETLTAPTALAWNPSVTGTKVEDTCLVHQEGLEIITTSLGWPVREVSAQGRTLLVADHLVLPQW
jgi:Xaa-Pro aminopeptidase